MELSLRKLAGPGVFLALVILVGNAWYAYQNTRRLIDKEHWVEHTQLVMAKLEQVQADVADATAAEQGFVATADGTLGNTYQTTRLDTATQLTELAGLILDNPSQLQRLSKIKDEIEQDYDALDKGMALKRTDNLQATPASTASTKLHTDDIRHEIAKMHLVEDALLQQRMQESKASFTSTFTTFAFATAAGAGLVILAYFLIRRDERLRRNANLEKGRLEAYNRLLLESTGDGIFGLDLNGNCTFLNAAGARLLATTPELVLGKNLHELIHSKHPDGSPYPADQCPTQKTLSSGRGSRVQDELFFRLDGSSFPVEYASYPILDEGKIAGAVVSFSDVSRRKQAESQLKLMDKAISASSVGVILTDATKPDHPIIYVNPAFERITGYSTDEVMGRNCRFLQGPGTDALRVAELRAAIKEGNESAVVIRNYRKDGTPFWNAIRISPVIGVSGRITHFVGIQADISEQRAAEAEKARLAHDNQLLLDSTGEGIYGIDTEGNCTFLNRAGSRMLGFSPKEIIGKNTHELIHHSLADGAPYPQEQCPIFRAVRTGQGSRVDSEVFWRKDGSSFPVEYSSFPIFENQAVKGAVVTFSDITIRKRAEEELTRAKEEAEGANLAKSQFLANMSHELRTPLNAVIMYSELLQEEATDAGVKQFVPDLDKIRAAGKHLLSLVNGVLDLSKIEAGKMELFLETFDVCPMVKEVATTVQPLVEAKHNQLEMTCDNGVGVIHADLTKVRQILFNILSNSCKFTENGTIKFTVAHEPSSEGIDVVFRITDSGIGMTPEQVEKLFQPFTQADASTTRKFGGTGLGLVISKRFVEMMGGAIEVTSEAGKGSTFTVRLPTRVAMQSADQPAPANARGETHLQKTPGVTTVLVIDDEQSVRDLVSRTLAPDGVRTILAADGEEGLRLAKQVHPDIIFLDVLMPRMDGWAVLTHIKADASLSDIPVIMLTIMSKTELGYMLGASEYLAKPIDKQRLNSVLNKYRPHGSSGVVMVVEDDEPTRQVICRTLTNQRWTVVEAENGRVALQKMEQTVPGLILLDLMMPEMDGFEFLAALRHNPAWRSIPVVVTTSKDITPEERTMLSGKVERILQKGAYSRQQLLEEVRKIVAACTAASTQPAVN